jgi:hypothetical protein
MECQLSDSFSLRISGVSSPQGEAGGAPCHELPGRSRVFLCAGRTQLIATIDDPAAVRREVPRTARSGSTAAENWRDRLAL